MTTTDELQVVRALRTTEDPSPAAYAAAAARLQERMAATDRPGENAVAGRRPPAGGFGGWMRRGPARRRPLLLAATVSVAAVALVVGFAVSGGDSGLQPASASAQQALNGVATVAEQREDRLLQPGEYWYTQSRAQYLGTAADENPGPFSMLQASTLQTWIDRAGSGRIVTENSGEPKLLGPRDRQRWEAAGRPALGVQRPSRRGTDAQPDQDVQSVDNGGFSFGSKAISYADLQALPTDGPAMYRALLKGAGNAGPSPDEEVFTMIGDLLRSSPVPPDVRAGLYRAAAYIKGIRLVGPVRDQLGRRGVAVELDSIDRHRRLIFDPDTALLLAEQDVLAKRVDYVDAAPGTVVSERIVVRQGIAPDDRTPVR